MLFYVIFNYSIFAYFKLLYPRLLYRIFYYYFKLFHPRILLVNPPFVFLIYFNLDFFVILSYSTL